MPFVETRLISPTTLTTSAASALYTVPTGYSAIIKQLVVTNITGTTATFTFYIGAASAGNALFSGTSVAANDTVIINLSQVLSTGEVLRALASTGSALNLTVSGVINDGPLASTATYIPDNAITSAKIAAGAIVNDDVNGSAAIAQTKIANLTSDLALKAPLASPVFTGTPSLPLGTTAATQIAGNNTTAVATTAFANQAGGLVFVKSQTIGSAVTSVTVPNAFSATYDHYLIQVSGGTCTIATELRLRVGATVSGYYYQLLYGGWGNTALAEGGTNAPVWPYTGTAFSTGLAMNCNIYNPFQPTRTRIWANYFSSTSDAGTVTGMLDNSTQYTDLVVLANSGNMTGGVITVYGYRK